MKFVIDTDLSIGNTFVSIDGVKLSDNCKVASMSFMADAPNTKYNDDGYVSFTVTSFDAEGNVKRENYSKRPELTENIKPIGINDELKLEDFISFVGEDTSSNDKVKLVDAIVAFCKTNNIPVADSEQLLSRSIDSLKDKASDLGLSSEEF